MIDLNDITIRICGKTLLEHASAHIPDNKKVGLVGFNGCGKSTLFKAIQNEISLEDGQISYPTSSRLAFMAQEIADTSVGILPFILSKDTEREALLKALETAPDIELPAIYERLSAIKADSANARACQILKGLGFKDSDFYRTLSEFSGGWRMRVALAGTLFQPSDILLLDEPTNHLDLESSMWLLSFLQKYRGSLLLISHDRNFLNNLCNMIVHFECKKLNTYNGNYDTYLRTRAEQQNLQQKMLEKQENVRKHLQSFVDRFRYKATKAKQAQSRLKMLERLSMQVVDYETAFTHFSFPEPDELVSPIIKMENGSTGYEQGKEILSKLNLQIDKDDRIALLGANGNGKSTLAKLLDGKLPLFTGEMTASKKLKIGYFAQHQTELLPFGQTPVMYIGSLIKGANETKIRTHLARFGLEGQKALTQIDKLSGGEKARLLFAGITCDRPNLLILDEPTNHLDIEARDGLVEALNAYAGAVILITHDMHLIETVADRLWLVANGTCKPFDEDIDAYKKLVLSATKTPASEEAKEKAPVLSPKEKRQMQAAKHAALRPIRDEIKRIEEFLSKANRRIADIENLFTGQLLPAQMVDLQKELAELNKQVEQNENRWLELSEKLEE